MSQDDKFNVLYEIAFIKLKNFGGKQPPRSLQFSRLHWTRVVIPDSATAIKWESHTR